MTLPQSRLVTVVIPAYNAAATIDETLRSVRAQTYRDLEILVVDDGSGDDTPAVVLRHAAQDPRVRLIRQANGGVAAARNRAIEEAAGAFVAPVDADDLWRCDKIERQMQALDAGGERVALVYTWYATIDEQGRVTSWDHHPQEEGDVLARMCLGNLVGNGSSTLMRRDAVIEAGGYDPSLRARKAQGCEDLQLYFRIAERHHFAVVRDYLTGYRQTIGNMSGDAAQMLRSFDLVMAEFRARYPEHAALFHQGRSYLLVWFFDRAVLAGPGSATAALVRTMLAHDRRLAMRIPARWINARARLSPELRRRIRATLRLKATMPPCFLAEAPAETARQ